MAKSNMDERPLLWIGCAYRNVLPDLHKEITRLLNRLGVQFETLDKEECCGFPLILSGNNDEAKRFAERNIRQIGDKKRVVTACPACYRAFNEFYPNLLKSKLPFRSLSYNTVLLRTHRSRHFKGINAKAFEN